jgi:hypothetical protein
MTKPLSSVRLYLSLLFSCFFCSVAFAQKNYFYFDKPIEMPWGSDVVYVYQVPVDSVDSVVYGNRRLTPQTPWMKHPLYIMKSNAFDSLFNTVVVAPGYYIIANAQQSIVNLNIRRKAAFYSRITDMRDLLLLETKNNDHTPVTDARITLGGKPLTYNDLLRAYVLDVKDGERLEIRKGNDVEFYMANKTRYKPYEPYYNNDNYYGRIRGKEPVAYKGYVVTNKPKYLPGDTVKYKAYLLNAKTNKPIDEPIAVTLSNYPPFQIHTIQPQAPGVYYSEFVLGD